MILQHHDILFIQAIASHDCNIYKYHSLSMYSTNSNIKMSVQMFSGGLLINQVQVYCTDKVSSFLHGGR